MNRQRRFKSKHNAAVYHCISRTINGEKLFDAHAKEILQKQLHQAAEFSGVEIVTYALMSNHFHVLVRVPEQGVVSNEELLRRYKALYPQPTKWATAQIEVLEATLKQGGKDAQELRDKLLRRMNDVSEFMKTFKQRFAIWFNRSHKRFGHLWAERFTSTIIEGNRHFALQMVAAYIDLNPIRAGMVKDPKDYRWCGYGEAATSTEDTAKTMLRGLRSALSEGELLDDAGVLTSYRVGLFAKGAAPKRRDAKAVTISKEAFEKEMKAAEHLPEQEENLRKRESRFSRGGVVGSRNFVTDHLAKYRQETKRRGHLFPKPFSEEKSDALTSLFSMRNHK
jgi:REP element-mobilizing transposase RayT